MCLIYQSAYGHPAHKPTWLYYKGESKPSELRWVSGIAKVLTAPNPATATPGLMTTDDRNASPNAFKEVLIKLAKDSIK